MSLSCFGFLPGLCHCSSFLLRRLPEEGRSSKRAEEVAQAHRGGQRVRDGSQEPPFSRQSTRTKFWIGLKRMIGMSTDMTPGRAQDRIKIKGSDFVP